MEISTVYMSQEGVCDDHDTENEYEIEDDDTQQCGETGQWLSEDYSRQRCEVKAGRDAKKCCRILTALGRKDWRTWNHVPLELRKEIERIHRNVGHASADQLEKLFPDANASDEAVSALKHFRCDACDRLQRPPSKRRVAVNHAETFNDSVSMDVNFWKITFNEFPSCEDDTEGVEHRGCRIRYAYCDSDCADHTAETIWKAFATGWSRWAGSPRCLRGDPHSSQIARGFFDKAEGHEAYLLNQHRL